MPTVPQYHREVAPQLTPTPYVRANVNGDMFGENIARAQENLGNAMSDFVKGMVEIKDRIDNTKILELANRSAEWEQKNLYDKENGYYRQFGKDAYGRSEGLLKDYDQYMNDYISKSGFSPAAQARAKDTYGKLRSRIMEGVTTHDFKQGVEWAKTEAQTAQNNYLNTAVNLRNNPEEINKAIQSGFQAIEMQGEISHLDASTINLMKMQYRSDVHEAVFQSLLGEGSLKAGQYLEEHKSEIDPTKLPRYIAAAKNEEMKYQARSIADNLFATCANEEEALNRAESIENIELSEQVVSRVKRRYGEQEHFKNEAEKQALNTFYNIVLQKQQSGETLSYDDIPDGVDAQTKLSLMNYINKDGEPEDDSQIWNELYEKSVNDAQGFVKEDLNKYRGFLSDGQYQSFVKKQQEIKEGKFYTNIKDDDDKIQNALKAIGLSGGKKENVAFSEIRSLVREYEARKGRKINDNELEDIINSLGYKDESNVKLFKQIEKGMAERTGFIKDVINDFAYYQSKHNGEMPSDEEKMKIINKRVNSVILKQNNNLQTSLSSPYAPKVGDFWMGHKITSTFGARTAPTQGASTQHKGIDLKYNNNEIFKAFASGTVELVGKSNTLGNFVDIKDTNGIIHRYGHANSIIVKKGDSITAGQGIGRAGSTGVSTGVHVHYAKIKDGKFLNPLDNSGETLAQNNQNKGWAF